MSDICGSQAAARSMQQLAREFSACRDMLVALGNENRQLIFVALLEHPGGVRVGDLAKLARLSHPATSHHLKVLQDAGLVDHYQQGTKNFYHASARLDRWAQLARVTAHAEQFVCCIALGYGEKPGAAHQVKPIEKLGRTAAGSELATAPAWFAAGLEAAQLAPTAVNQQRFRFELAADEHAVHARALPAVSCGRIDLGIAKLHFELGANSASRDWSFA